MKEKEIKQFVDDYYNAIEKHRYFPGNYSNTCTKCKKEFHWADKMCFICSDCIDKSKNEKLGSDWEAEEIGNRLSEVVGTFPDLVDPSTAGGEKEEVIWEEQGIVGEEQHILKELFDSLFLEIKHGDNEHQEWLKNKIDEFYNRHVGGFDKFRIHSMLIKLVDLYNGVGGETADWDDDWDKLWKDAESVLDSANPQPPTSGKGEDKVYTEMEMKTKVEEAMNKAGFIIVVKQADKIEQQRVAISQLHGALGNLHDRAISLIPNYVGSLVHDVADNSLKQFNLLSLDKKQLIGLLKEEKNSLKTDLSQPTEITKLKSGEQFSREDMKEAFEAAQNDSYWDEFEEWLNDYLTEVKQKK